MKHPKTTPPRPYTPNVRSQRQAEIVYEKAKEAVSAKPFLASAIEKALAETPISAAGGALIREDLEKVLMEAYTKSFPGFAKFAKASTAVKHSWYPTYGTPMQSISGTTGSAMALGNGEVYCFDHEGIEPGDDWEADTE